MDVVVVQTTERRAVLDAGDATLWCREEEWLFALSASTKRNHLSLFRWRCARG